jgi:hypothetical protein
MTLQGWQHAVTAIGTTWVSRDVGELLLMVFHGTLLASEALTRCMASGAAWASCGAKTTRGLLCDGRVQRRPLGQGSVGAMRVCGPITPTIPIALGARSC